MDAVTFGLVTSVMVYMWGFQGVNAPVGKIIGFIFLSAGVIRLARFNVLKEAHVVPSNVFMGLPIPLGALAICSVILIYPKPLLTFSHSMIFALYVILVSILMVSNIRYRTMKKIKSENNLIILLFLAIVIAFSINFPKYTIPALTLLYIISPIFFFIFYKFHTPKIPAPPVSNEEPTDKTPGNEAP